MPKYLLILKALLASAVILNASCHKDSDEVKPETLPDGSTKITFALKSFDGPLANPHKGFTVPTDGTYIFSPECRKMRRGNLLPTALDISNGTNSTPQKAFTIGRN